MFLLIMLKASCMPKISFLDAMEVVQNSFDRPTKRPICYRSHHRSLKKEDPQKRRREKNCHIITIITNKVNTLMYLVLMDSNILLKWLFDATLRLTKTTFHTFILWYGASWPCLWVMSCRTIKKPNKFIWANVVFKCHGKYYLTYSI